MNSTSDDGLHGRAAYQIPPDWRTIAQRVVKPGQTVMVIGAIDVGKSTFCRFLIDCGIANGLKVGFVDADVGQSQIGPPTTIGLKIFSPQSDKTEYTTAWGSADSFYFIGWISPNNHLLQCVVGTRLMVDAARQAGANFIVVDTTGYVDGGAAVALKTHKIEAVQPTHLIGIRRSRELEPILAPFEQLETPVVHRLTPSKEVKAKSPNFRRGYREAGFKGYFLDCVLETIPFSQIRGQRTPFFIGRPANTKELDMLSDFVRERVIYAEWGNKVLAVVALTQLPNLVCSQLKQHLSLTSVISESPLYFERRLVGLLNARGEPISLGIIEAVDFETPCLTVRCKAGAGQAAKVVQFGEYRDVADAEAAVLRGRQSTPA